MYFWIYGINLLIFFANEKSVKCKLCPPDPGTPVQLKLKLLHDANNVLDYQNPSEILFQYAVMYQWYSLTETSVQDNLQCDVYMKYCGNNNIM